MHDLRYKLITDFAHMSLSFKMLHLAQMIQVLKNLIKLDSEWIAHCELVQTNGFEKRTPSLWTNTNHLIVADFKRSERGRQWKLRGLLSTMEIAQLEIVKHLKRICAYERVLQPHQQLSDENMVGRVVVSNMMKNPFWYPLITSDEVTLYLDSVANWQTVESG